MAVLADQLVNVIDLCWGPKTQDFFAKSFNSRSPKMIVIRMKLKSVVLLFNKFNEFQNTVFGNQKYFTKNTISAAQKFSNISVDP